MDPIPKKHIPDEDNNPFRCLADLVLSNEESIAVLATAIEKNDIYCWDRFGRFNKATESDKRNALDLLAEQHKWEREQEPPYEQNPLEAEYHHPLYLFGWAKNVLPKFDDIRNSLTEVNPPQRQSAETKRKTTLLVAIAALGHKLGLKINREGKSERGVSVKLQKIIEEFGQDMSDDTIRNFLGELPEAIERRQNKPI